MIAMFELFVNNTYIVLLQHSTQVATDSRIMKWIHGPIQGNIDGTVYHIVPSSRETQFKGENRSSFQKNICVPFK